MKYYIFVFDKTNKTSLNFIVFKRYSWHPIKRMILGKMMFTFSSSLTLKLIKSISNSTVQIVNKIISESEKLLGILSSDRDSNQNNDLELEEEQ